MSSTIQIYKDKIQILDTMKDDNELYHVERDKIYEQFIKDVKNGEFKLNEIGIIASMIDEKVIQSSVRIWYS